MKNTKFARILRRLLGDEAGATMMEYVILAVMIAAAVTAAAIYFGNSTKNQMKVASEAMVGNTKQAEVSAESSRDINETDTASAHTSAKRFSDPTDELQSAK
ncbi:MAG: hypothetical protein J6P13_07300 [Kiritimatiellae bacterium]|nr:hypothetical protein [Kiritimatiellia bacterium]